MAIPVEITSYDEVKSVQMYVSLLFQNDEIRVSRPQEDEKYDTLIEFGPMMTEGKNDYYDTTDVAFTVQRWCADYKSALVAAEQLNRLFAKGLAGVGKRDAIPVWSWKDRPPRPFPVPIEPPDPLPPDWEEPDPLPADKPARYLKVTDNEHRVLLTEVGEQYVAVCDIQATGWRIVYDLPDLIEAVNVEYP